MTGMTGMTGMTYERSAEEMKQTTGKDFQQFIKRIHLKNVAVIPLFILGKKPAKAIKEVVDKEQIDLGQTGRMAVMRAID